MGEYANTSNAPQSAELDAEPLLPPLPIMLTSRVDLLTLDESTIHFEFHRRLDWTHVRHLAKSMEDGQFRQEVGAPILLADVVDLEGIKALSVGVVSDGCTKVVFSGCHRLRAYFEVPRKIDDTCAQFVAHMLEVPADPTELKRFDEYDVARNPHVGALQVEDQVPSGLPALAVELMQGEWSHPCFWNTPSRMLLGDPGSCSSPRFNSS